MAQARALYDESIIATTILLHSSRSEILLLLWIRNGILIAARSIPFLQHAASNFGFLFGFSAVRNWERLVILFRISP